MTGRDGYTQTSAGHPLVISRRSPTTHRATFSCFSAGRLLRARPTRPGPGTPIGRNGPRCPPRTSRHPDATRRWPTTAGTRRSCCMAGGLIPDQGEGHDGSDTWTWNGNDWTEVSAGNNGPGDRSGPRMVAAGNRVLMFRGHIFNTSYFADAWAWGGGMWSRVDHGSAPAGRSDAAVARGPDDPSLFGYGGLGMRPNAGPGNLGLPLGDAWSMKNGAWRQLPAAGGHITADANAIWKIGRASCRERV